MTNFYRYTTNQGRAVLCKGDDKPLKRIGDFKTEREALEACRAHYAKAQRAAANLNRSIPPAFYA